MWLVIGLTMILLFNIFNNKTQTNTSSLTYSQFLTSIDSKSVNRVTINGNMISGTLKDGKPFQTISPSNDPELIPALRKADVDITVQENQKESWWMTIFLSLIHI
jgi:cell division protease FtsH